MKMLLLPLLLLLAACGTTATSPEPEPTPPSPPTAPAITPASLCTRMIMLDRALKGIIDKELQRMFSAEPPLREPGIKRALAGLRDHIDGATGDLDAVDLGGHDDFAPMREGVRRLFASYRRQFADEGWSDFLIARDRPEALLQQPRQARLVEEQMQLTLELRRLQLELARKHGFADRLRLPAKDPAPAGVSPLRP